MANTAYNTRRGDMYMTDEEISRYTLRNYGYDSIAIIKEFENRRKELFNLPPEEAKIVALQRLQEAGIVDESGKLMPQYGGE